MWVLMSLMQRHLLFVINNDMRDLIQLLRGPLRKMIPGTRLPVIDRLGRQNPRGQIQQQVIRQRIDKRLVHSPYVTKTHLGILFALQP